MLNYNENQRNWRLGKLITYRLLIPFLGEIEFNSMDNEKGIDNDEKMMRVPKGVESS